MAYVDKVFNTESPKIIHNLIVFGYSQGVSIATRWVASRKIKFNHLILHSGGIPTELTPEDFSFLKNQVKVTYIYGNKDQYISEARKTKEQLKGNKLFGKHLSFEVFEGIHEVNTNFIKQVSEI